jgi:hypothetical protein
MQHEIIAGKGRRAVAIASNDGTGPFWARLYVNCTELEAYQTQPTHQHLGDATLLNGTFQTLKGARRWADKQLAA